MMLQFYDKWQENAIRTLFFRPFVLNPYADTVMIYIIEVLRYFFAVILFWCNFYETN